MQTLASQDWLGVRRIFYNQKTGEVSESIQDLIDFSNFEFDQDGLKAYLDFGYCVFGLTPIKDIRFLRTNQALIRNQKDEMEVINNVDPCLSMIENNSTEKDTWELIEETISSLDSEELFEICIPTSGGYDSRFLNFFFPSKHKIKAFSYGVSKNQAISTEVVKAKYFCNQHNISWDFIELGNYNNYLSDWINLYGVSTHAHGMYHMEFYTKIKELYGVMPLLSGIIGDLWAGSISAPEIKHPSDLKLLGLSRGIHADSSAYKQKHSGSPYEEEFEREKEKLQSERYRMLYLIRNKIMLLSYLTNIPKKLGFEPESPYLNLDVSMSMLTLDENRWKNRIWQKDFIVRNNLDVEFLDKKASTRNDLDFVSMAKVPLKPLKKEILSEFFDRDYIEWINRNVNPKKLTNYFSHSILASRYTGRVASRLGVTNTAITAHSAYMTIKPIEDLLIKRIKKNDK